MSIRIAVGCLLLWISSNAFATNFVVEGGLHFGGDRMLEVVFTSGSTEELRAGELISFGLGAGFTLSEAWQSRLTFGIKIDEISATNGYLSFARYPLDLVFIYQQGQWGFGGGLTYHLNPSLDATGIATDYKADFDNALGLLGEIDWFFSGSAYLGLRFTAIDYQSVPTATSAAEKVNGNSIGIMLGASF